MVEFMEYLPDAWVDKDGFVVLKLIRQTATTAVTAVKAASGAAIFASMVVATPAVAMSDFVVKTSQTRIQGAPALRIVESQEVPPGYREAFTEKMRALPMLAEQDISNDPSPLL